MSESVAPRMTPEQFERIQARLISFAAVLREAANEIRADSLAEYEAHWTWLDEIADALARESQ